MQDDASDALPLLSIALNEICPAWWDTKPFVHYLASAFHGLNQFSHLVEICKTIQCMQAGNVAYSSAASSPKPPSIQAEATKLIIAHSGGYSFYSLLNKRCSAIGLENIVLSRTDVTNAFEILRSLPPSIAIHWLKTVSNAWCTTSRMHESSSLPCIFGCAGQEDRLSHYMHCITLWSILHESFGGYFAPSLVSRIGYLQPSPKKFIIIACAFEIYHALKVGNRNIVEECVATFRFSKVVHHASRIAVDYRKSYADQFKEYSGTSLAQGRSSTSHIPRSNVGALRSHPRRQLY